MPPSDPNKRLKEEAKALSTRVAKAVEDTPDPKDRMIRTVCIHAGMITESLIEFEEPDAVMEQVFARIADLLRCDPAAVIDEGDLIPLAWIVERDGETGRRFSRLAGRKLPRGLDDAHEIAIGLFINEAPVWEKQGVSKPVALRLLIEMVILSLTFEMATQDFCDMLIEDYITDSKSAAEALFGLGAVMGTYFAEALEHYVLPLDAEACLTDVMSREARRHGTPGHRDWKALAAANDVSHADINKYLNELEPEVEGFFEFVGLNDPLAEAVAIAKAVGRMVAVITVEDVGQIHPSIAKSLAKTGMILGSKYKV